MADDRGDLPDDVDLPEQPVQQDPQVLAGEDDLPRQPTSQRDPFVPEPGPRPGEARAFAWLRWAWIPLLVAVAVVVWAAVR
ncbi:MAG: hypothetical protein ICV64_11570 [Thermoleophilia bacterium]|nr:hypothetical protein [Thermoleophilia bacterium]